jgi:hypothetical protein
VEETCYSVCLASVVIHYYDWTVCGCLYLYINLFDVKEVAIYRPSVAVNKTTRILESLAVGNSIASKDVIMCRGYLKLLAK